MQKQLESELKLRQEVEKELSSQRHLRSESEVATRLLEKNIQEKQDSIISMYIPNINNNYTHSGALDERTRVLLHS